ncbi:MAG: BppU family phage baseplate upper protein [Pseudobutyrivibrio sp.]|nr:BppU family phage baseplate upper protein [Pseudobutyrivibrio sp.]
MAREVSTDFLRIDLTDGKTRKVISACQSDTIQRTLHFLVVNAGKPLDLTNLFYAEIIVKRTDGTYLDNACVIDGNDIQYTLKSTDVAVIGENEAHLLLSFKDGTVKETPTFYLNVFSTFYNPSAIQSQSEYTALVNKVLDAQEAANEALESKNAAEAAAVDAADSADEAGAYVDAASQYTSEAGTFASTAGFYASEAGSYLASASNVTSEVEAVSEYMSTTSEYLESASEYASQASSYAVDAGDYIASASEYASTAASEAAVGANYVSEVQNYMTSTSEYEASAASEASFASSCADVAEAAAYGNTQEISVIKNDVPWYGTCPTAASTQTKVATTNDSKFSLVEGAKVAIKFTYDNTHATPQLNVDGTGAKSIKAYGTTTPTLFWKAGDVAEFVYDGNNWILKTSTGVVEQINSDLSKKMSYRLIELSGTNIFDIMSYSVNYPIGVTYYAECDYLTNGQTVLHTLLGVSQYATVVVEKISVWIIKISIADGGSLCTTSVNHNATNINFVKIVSGQQPTTVTVSKATS